KAKNDILIRKQIQDAKIDVAFNILHGALGEDGRIQDILEDLKIPYVGSGPEASRLTINKASTQKVLAANGIKIPYFFLLTTDKKSDLKSIIQRLGFPVVVKPTCQGSSIGVSIVRKSDELMPAVEQAFSYDKEILIEQYIPGREMTVGILHQTPLPVIQVMPKAEFFDFTAKYGGTTDYKIPAPIPEDVAFRMQQAALKVHTVLGCRHFSRVDFILDATNEFYVLEINTVPGFTEMSLLPKAARFAGISFQDLCLYLLKLAYGEKERKENIQHSVVVGH
ncbi:MAG: D-alanine--D-alanine ligase, partial [Sedimentisphaerales bacterium]|nr:D-alanine--D-alanine ligase [Sedimentisphaerales bacterium]